jgi:uncharacterized protein YdhG (YjbR/CyaY superfamily)
MAPPKSRSKNVDEYVSKFPKNVRDVLEELRRVIREAAPEAEETFSYGMPTFKLNGKALVYFAAWKKHIGLYPVTPALMEAFKKELSQLKTSTGTLQLPLDKQVPFDLVKRIVKFRVKESEKNA